ncbi:uncharacterized protein GLRG_10105 [Colletotrichum graminicola M1.001]|uniref:Uncharacterized protein n=1 Tax=Colletotrichum graminicola (strain M1.001 / M2 / FGSC 10212) TaxID=645133 RepID=E3QVS3_COLGM|nr:uncharacterized protein GLRG_10105 [Colletotrichum graminicola M1.001]EFQ34961.1 hypothetical protein GLRG_10105 [Colletotrichum graminicola M1.001]
MRIVPSGATGYREQDMTFDHLAIMTGVAEKVPTGAADKERGLGPWSGPVVMSMSETIRMGLEKRDPSAGAGD